MAPASNPCPGFWSLLNPTITLPPDFSRAAFFLGGKEGMGLFFFFFGGARV
jgi:hypothetical protein